MDQNKIVKFSREELSLANSLVSGMGRAPCTWQGRLEGRAV